MTSTPSRSTRVLPTGPLPPAPVGSAPARPALPPRAPHPATWARLLRVPVLLTLLAVVLGEIAALAWVDRWTNQGVVWGPQQTPIAGTEATPLGVNVFLELESDKANVRRSLDLVRDGGFQWIRQGLPWSDIEIAGKGDFVDRRNGAPISAWDKYDYIINQALARHLEILARIDAPPAWAQRPRQTQNACGGDQVDFGHSPPARNSDYADFVAAVVSRYRGKIRYFQIWNEPNLIGEWPPQPNAVEYTALLKTAATAAHAANPDAVVVLAPLAQTYETEGSCNPTDLVYLQDLYTSGAQPYFDIASVMAYGLVNGPDDRRADFDRINFSRPLLARDIMVRNGDAAKGVWASEFGWVSLPANWRADPANKPGIWGNVSPAVQAANLVGGYQRARAEWPWMGPMFVWHLRDPQPKAHEPQPYFGILNFDFSPRPAYVALQAYSRRFPTADTGAGTPAGPAFVAAGPWQPGPAPGPAVYTATSPSSVGTLTFQGEEVALVFAAGPRSVPVQVLLDGRPPPGWPVDSGGQGSLTVPARGAGADRFEAVPAWPAPLGVLALRVLIAANLAPTWHALTIRPGNVDTPLLLLGYVVAREPAQGGLFAAGYLLLTGLALWLGVRGTFALRAVPCILGAGRRAWPAPSGAQAGGGLVLAGLALALTAYYLLPAAPFALLALGVWLLLAILRPDFALMITAATLPFYWTPRALFGWSFPLSETGLWLTLLAWAANRAWRAWRVGRPLRPARHPAVPRQGAGGAPEEVTPTRYFQLYRELQGPVPWGERLRTALARDLGAAPALALLVVGTFSLLTVANPDFLKSSLHAYRWVVVEPVLLYFLATDIFRERGGALRLAAGYVAGATLAAALALVLGVLRIPGSILDVQGVVRFQGLFTDPNNLALFLERALAFTLGLAILWHAPGDRRRLVYAAAALVMAPALLLSYSRGAWLAVAVALGVILWLAGAHAARVFAALLGVGLAGLLVAAAAHLLPDRILTLGSGLIRLDLWKIALQMLRDHSLFGIGLDQFLNQEQGPYFVPALQGEILSHPHNLLLDCWLSLGIMGVLLAGWLALRLARAGWRLARRGAGQSRALAGAVLAGLAAMVVHGLVDNSYFLQDLALTFWLFCALLQLSVRTEG